MPSGDVLTEGQIREISRAVSTASNECGLHFSVFIGPVERTAREYAERLHTALGARSVNSVLVLVAPGERQLEIVTGARSRRRLDDRSCALAALSMTTSFSGGDIVGGIVTGLRMMSEAAGHELAAT